MKKLILILIIGFCFLVTMQTHAQAWSWPRGQFIERVILVVDLMEEGVDTVDPDPGWIPYGPSNMSRIHEQGDDIPGPVYSPSDYTLPTPNTQTHSKYPDLPQEPSRLEDEDDDDYLFDERPVELDLELKPFWE